MAGNQAFPILAGYIFGKYKGDKNFAMTAPVTQAATRGGFIVQFVLRKGVTLASAPEPLDARVHLQEVPGSRVAVIRYSGFWSQGNFDEHMAWIGEPILSRYDPPFTPCFRLRNVIWLNKPSERRR